MNELTTIDNTAPDLIGVEEEQPDLTAQEIAFTRYVSKGYSGVRAYKLAFPAKSHLKSNTVRQYVTDLLAKTDIYEEIATATRTQARLARQAEHRIDEILTTGSIGSKTNKVAEVSMFMYEQANGKATMKIQTENKHVVVTYNLTGTDEQIPDDIRKQLEI